MAQGTQREQATPRPQNPTPMTFEHLETNTISNTLDSDDEADLCSLHSEEGLLLLLCGCCCGCGCGCVVVVCCLLCVVVVCCSVLLLCVVGVFRASPPDPPLRRTPPSTGPPSAGPPKISLFFSLPHFFFLFSLSCWSLVVFLKAGTLKCAVWALGLWCETPAAPPDRAAGAHTTTRELQHVYIRTPGPPPKFHEKTSREGRKERILWREREKNAKFWAPFGALPGLGPTAGLGPWLAQKIKQLKITKKQLQKNQTINFKHLKP